MSLIRVPTSARGSPPRHTHQAHLRGYHITHAENFDQLDKEIRAKLANLDDNNGFRGPGSAHLAELKADPQLWRSCQLSRRKYERSELRHCKVQVLLGVHTRHDAQFTNQHKDAVSADRDDDFHVCANDCAGHSNQTL